MKNPKPEYVFTVSKYDGTPLGSVALAPSAVLGDEESVAARVQRWFQEINPGIVVVKRVTDQKVHEVAPHTVNLRDVLMDVTTATECCVMKVTQFCNTNYPLKPDDEVLCESCRSNWRYTGDGQGNYAWLWMLPKKYAAKPDRQIFPLGQLLDDIEARKQAIRAEDEAVRQASSPNAKAVRTTSEVLG